MSDSRVQILNKIKALNLEKKAHPVIPQFPVTDAVLSQFKESLEANHVDVLEDDQSFNMLKKLLSEGTKVYSCVEDLADVNTISKEDLLDKNILSILDFVVVNGEMGVAENAAIWVPETNIESRIMSFITLHFVVILRKSSVVGNMHQAYAKIKELPGFGVFVAGPSKTADIEQSLVIGAHGPKQMTVVLVD